MIVIDSKDDAEVSLVDDPVVSEGLLWSKERTSGIEDPPQESVNIHRVSEVREDRAKRSM